MAFQTQPQGPEQEARPQCFLSPVPFVEQQLAHSLLLIPGFTDLCPGRQADEHPGSFPRRTKPEVKASSAGAGSVSREGRGTKNGAGSARPPSRPQPCCKRSPSGSWGNLSARDLSVRRLGETPAPRWGSSSHLQDEGLRNKQVSRCKLTCESESRSVVSDSMQPHGLHSSWNSPGQNTGVGGRSLLQGIFLIKGSNLGLPHCRGILYQPPVKPN